MPEIKPIEVVTGVVSVPVRDPYGREDIITFNPADTMFRQRFFEMAAAVSAKKDSLLSEEERLLEKYAGECENSEMQKQADYAALEEEICSFCEESIDAVFGKDTCKKVFGGDRVVFAYPKFLEAVAPYIKESSGRVMDEYIKDKANRQQRRTQK